MFRTALLCCLLAACSGAPPSARPPGGGPTAAAPTAADETFGRFVDEFFDARARFSPTQAVGEGFHAHDAEIEDRSAARIGQRVAELHAFQDRLARIDRGALGFD